MVNNDKFRDDVISFVINDICGGIFSDTIYHSLSGRILNKKEQTMLTYVYTGEVEELFIDSELENHFEKVLDPYFDEFIKKEKEAELFLNEETPRWSQEYYGCEIDKVPFVDISELYIKSKGQYISQSAELAYLADALKIKEQYVYKAFDKALYNYRKTVQKVLERNKQIIQNIHKLKDSLCDSANLNMVELVLWSNSSANSSIVLFRLKIFIYLLQKMLPHDLTNKYLHYIKMEDASLKMVLSETGDLHQKAWGEHISSDQRFVVQPLPYYCLFKTNLECTFINSLNYNIALVLYTYFLTRYNYPKKRKIKFNASLSIINDDMNEIFYYVDDDAWNPNERQRFFLQNNFSVCYFNGSINQIAEAFNFSSEEFKLLSTDCTVSVYEWKTRFFIQMPHFISNGSQRQIIQHTVDCYLEALQNYKILHFYHD